MSHLPPSWGTLYELTKLPPPELVARIEDGVINLKMQRKDVSDEAGETWVAADIKLGVEL